MNFISRWFSKSPPDLLAKGDKHMESGSYFDARTCYEDGMRLCSGDDSHGNLKTLFSERIDSANRKLGERNLGSCHHKEEGCHERQQGLCLLFQLVTLGCFRCDHAS